MAVVGRGGGAGNKCRGRRTAARTLLKAATAMSLEIAAGEQDKGDGKVLFIAPGATWIALQRRWH